MEDFLVFSYIVKRCKTYTFGTEPVPLHKHKACDDRQCRARAASDCVGVCDGGGGGGISSSDPAIELLSNMKRTLERSNRCSKKLSNAVNGSKRCMLMAANVSRYSLKSRVAGHLVYVNGNKNVSLLAEILGPLVYVNGRKHVMLKSLLNIYDLDCGGWWVALGIASSIGLGKHHNK
ncbi:hypothetical protein Tco_1540009 [Tanacetum coccineum]